MSLTAEDLLHIRAIMREEIEPLSGQVTAVENDVKELYGITDRMRQDMRRGFRQVNQRLQRLETHANLPAPEL